MRGTHWMYSGKAYVSEYGNWGQEELVVFDKEALTEKQYITLSEMSDNDRLSYVVAILNGEDVSEYEDD